MADYSVVKVDLFAEEALRAPRPAVYALLGAASFRNLEGLKVLSLGLFERWEALSIWERQAALFRLAEVASRGVLDAAEALAARARMEDPL